MIEDSITDQLESVIVNDFDELVHVLECTIRFVDIFVVGDIVAL